MAADINKGNDISHMDEIVADFGALGLWRWKHGVYPGTWLQISGANAGGALAVDDDCDGGQELQVDFGSLGLWRYDAAGGAGTWISDLLGCGSMTVTTPSGFRFPASARMKCFNGMILLLAA